MDRVSIERMCAGREFQVEGADTEKAPRGKAASNTGWSGKEICIGRTEGSGWKIVRFEFRQIDGLRGFPSVHTFRYLIGERSSVELFVVRVSGCPADAHASIHIDSLHPPPTNTHATPPSSTARSHRPFTIIHAARRWAAPRMCERSCLNRCKRLGFCDNSIPVHF